jgi:hypothetical protein
MGKQISLEVYLPNTNITVNISLLSDLIYVKAAPSADTPNLSDIYFFGNLETPNLKSIIFRSNASVDDIVAASDNSLVSCTVVRVGSGTNVTTPIQYAFPVSGDQINEVLNDSTVHSIITYRGQVYSVEELLDDLVTAANAGGGGSGGSTLFALTGSNTATGNVTGSLNGHRLQVQQAGSDLLDINPTGQYVSLNSGGTNTLTVDDGNDEILYTSDEHLFNGEVQIHGVLGTLTVGNNTNNSNMNLRADSGAGAQLLFTNLADHTLTIDAELVTVGRHVQIMDADGIIPVTAGTPFNGTLAAAISGSKNVVNGVIIN